MPVEAMNAAGHFSPARHRYHNSSHMPIHLTRREREIVAAILEGCTNREMARRFAVSEQTIKNQLSTLYEKVGISSRLELALFALQKGL